MFKYKGYTIEVSDKKTKKYMAIVDGKKVHFGDRKYEQYFDKIGHYRDQDHQDNVRRVQYQARHGASGNHLKPGTAAWFSWNLLW
jgi:hypothetical protein